MVGVLYCIGENMNKKILSAAIAVALNIPVSAFSSESTDIAELKQMLLEMFVHIKIVFVSLITVAHYQQVLFMNEMRLDIQVVDG